MRYGPDDTFWLVTDPTATSTLEDILCETSLRELELQFRGGLTMDRDPTIFTDRQEAEREAGRRLVAARAAAAILRPAGQAARVRVEDAGGGIVFEAEL